MIKVVLADDHVIVRNGIKSLLESEQDIQVVGEASNGDEAVKAVESLMPDLLIIDIRMPVLNGIEATRILKEQKKSTVPVLVLSMHDTEEYVLQSIQNGASGYILKDTGKDEFIKAIRKIHNGEKYYSSDITGIIVDNYLGRVNKPNENPEPPDNSMGAYAKIDFDLTRRERQILEFVVKGFSSKEIADKLGKSARTIETHRFNIMRKLNVKNVVELIKMTEEHGLLDNKW